jgi:hypothetical protein
MSIIINSRCLQWRIMQLELELWQMREMTSMYASLLSVRLRPLVRGLMTECREAECPMWGVITSL